MSEVRGVTGEGGDLARPEGTQPARPAGSSPASSAPDRSPVDAAPARPVRDRQVLLLAGVVVAIVLGAQALGLLVPGFEQLLALQPVMVLVLIVVTVLVLAQALRTSLRR